MEKLKLWWNRKPTKLGIVFTMLIGLLLICSVLGI